MIPGSTTLKAWAQVTDGVEAFCVGVVDVEGELEGDAEEEGEVGVWILLLGSTNFSKKKACFLNFWA